jgi:hypothetical protein
MRIKILTSNEGDADFKVNWDFGTDLMKELLDGISYVSSQKPPFKIETDGYSIYWAGSVLRIDIKDKELM